MEDNKNANMGSVLMKLEKKLISNVMALSFLSLLFIFSFTWIVFDFNDSSNAIKDSWSIVGSVFGGISTLAASYIAYSLYDDWRKPYNISIETEYKKEILKTIRKILPLEYRYNRLISDHFNYHDQPDRTMPITITNDNLSELTSYINELLSLLDELFFITKDKNITNLKNHYYNYAQLYTYILARSNYLFENDNKPELVEFLRTRLEFDFIRDGESFSNYTLYAYAFNGLDRVGLRKYISENLKLAEH